MGLKSFSSLARRVRDQRGAAGVRAAAHEIGVSPATLSRVEAGRLPDLETFAKFCRWLGADPSEFLDLPASSPHADVEGVVAHFKTDRELKPATTQALAVMVQLAVRHQLKSPGLDPNAEV